jgi:hypothetical protein
VRLADDGADSAFVQRGDFPDGKVAFVRGHFRVEAFQRRFGGDSPPACPWRRARGQPCPGCRPCRRAGRWLR